MRGGVFYLWVYITVKRNHRQFVNPRDRQRILGERRNLKMARSAHAYVRGNTLKFYEWLEADRCPHPQGPSVWICGDCHLGNLGPVADADDNVEIQIRDLDQTVIGNPAHDLIRLGLSLATAARGSDLPGVTTARMLEEMIAGYSDALASKGSRGIATAQRPDSVHLVMRKAVDRTWKHLARERIEDLEPTIPLGTRFWPLSKIEQRDVRRLFRTEEVRRVATCLRSREDDSDIELLDAAYWVKGCSSLGRLRIAALLRVGKKKNKESEFCLIDIKEAVKAAAPRSAAAGMPRDFAERVVEGARHLTPSLGERMVSASLAGKAVFIRELLPQDLKLEIDQLTQEEATKAARYLSMVVGKAHADQMDAATWRIWRKELIRNRSKNLEAPSWLWSSVVDLVTIHEAAYLDHCRKYAMNAAKP
jgi:uncharacterized protein (DUF2252 family)